ncbi:MAG: hypothetical protein AAB729_01995 [Patescibacteria group bacterium]
MDPIERENRLRGVALSRISRELDYIFFYKSDDQVSILKRSFEDIVRFHFHLDNDDGSLEQCRLDLEALPKDSQSLEKKDQIYKILSAIYNNYLIEIDT